MNHREEKRLKRMRRHRRVRAEIIGTSERPRLSIFRSNRFVWAQLIDDGKGITLAHATDWEQPSKGKKSGEKRENRLMHAEQIGKHIANLAAEKKISAFVFDRGGNKYHGRVKAVAEGVRKAGIQM